MPEVKRHQKVPYTASQMYDLVNDIHSYPEFLPWCGNAEIISQSEDKIEAALTISKGSLQKSFSTINRLQKDRMIEMRLLDGPFHHLEGFWKFQASDGGCEVSLDMDYEFSSKALGFFIGPIFGQIVGSLVESFCKRADELFAQG